MDPQGVTALTTAAGTWTWGAAAPGRPGEYSINLNGSSSGGVGVLMEVTNGGQLYVATAGMGWWLRQGTAWVQSAPPLTGPAGPAGPPNTLTLGLPVVGSSCKPGDSEFQTNRTVSPIILNIFVCDQTAAWAGPFPVAQ
jgi:hypothetical protein